MSQNDDTFKAQKRTQAHKLSTPHMRALRKELLIARADVERMELAQASADLRHSVKNFSVLKFLVPGRSGKGWGKLTGLLKQYPVLSSLASLILTKPVRTKLLRSTKPVLKWGGLGLLAWEAYRVWKQMKATSTETSSDAVDPTVF
jgi:hypothetical protein